MTLKPHLCGKNRIQMPNSGCNCESLTDADIDSVTPIKCKESEEVCPQESLGQLAYRFTDTARSLSPQ